MTSPLVKLSILYLLGLLIGFYTLFPYVYSIFLSLFFIFLFYLIKKEKIKNILLCFCLVTLASSWTVYFLDEQQAFLKKIEKQKVTIQGIVIKKEKDKFLLQTRKIKDEKNNFYLVKNKIRIYAQGEFIPGEILVLTTQLQPLPQARNPGQISPALILASQGIQAVAYPEKTIKKIGLEKGWIFFIFQKKEMMLQKIKQILPPNHAALTGGIVFGEAALLNEKKAEQFNKIGLTHVLAASGQNMIIITAFFLILARLSFFPEKLAFFLAFFALLLYTFAADCSPSIVRAAIMAVYFLLALLIKRRSSAWNSLALAFLLFLLYNPLTLWNISFQLSFLAVLSLLLFYTFWQDVFSFLPAFLADNLAVFCSVQLGVVPLCIYYFNQFSPLSFLANLIILPFLEGILILGLFFVLLPLNLLLTKALAGLLWLLATIAFSLTDCLSAFPVLILPSSLFLLCFYYLSLTIFFFIWHYRERKQTEGIIFLLSVTVFFLLYLSWQGQNPRLFLAFLDVGQGDAIFLQTPQRKNILFDCGGYLSWQEKKSNYGEKVIMPFLRKKGVKKLDYIFISHWHDDHVGGLAFLLDKIPVGKVILGQAPETKEWQGKIKKIPHLFLKRGEKILLDSGIVLYACHPSEVLLQGTHSDSNNNSLVLRLVYKKFTLLLTGDLEEEGEKDLLKNYHGILKSDLLKVGHHGSNFSSKNDFLSVIKPKVAIISVGKHNSFGHPHPETLFRLKDSKIYRTDEKGAIIVETSGDGYRISTVKKEKSLF